MELHGGQVRLLHNNPDGCCFRLLLLPPRAD